MKDFEHGWCNMTISRSGEVVVDFDFSYTPVNSMDDLVDAIDSMLTEYTERVATVRFHLEPAAISFRFVKKENCISLRVTEEKDLTRTVGDVIEILSFEGTFSQVCTPFWRGLRKIQSRYTEEECDKRWHRPFPYKAIENLGKDIKNKND